MNKKTAKKLVWQLTKGIGAIDDKLWLVYYRVSPEDFKIFKEKNWRWEVVLEYKGKLLFRIQIKQLEAAMVIDGKLIKFPYSINFETKEVKIW